MVLGQDFENMTKQKQMDNPKFQFLFGGEYYGYYTYRVTTEQAMLKHQAMRQQQQLSMTPPNQMIPQQQGMMGNPGFGISQGPPHAGRFGSPLQNFERQQGPGSPIPQIGQRFERSPFQNHNFNQMNFERPPGPAGGGNYPNFDRGQQHGHPQNFGGIQGQNSHMQMQSQQFERGQHGTFERYPGPGQRFDRPLHPEFHSPPLGHPMKPHVQGMRPGPVVVPPGPMRFDRPMGGGGDRPMVPPGPERNTSVFVNPNFDPHKNIQQAQQLPTVPPVNIEALTIQRKGLEEQILQSEKNLAGQQQVYYIIAS